MKRLLLPALAVLAGCAAPAPKTVTPSSVTTGIAAFTQADLANAIAIATAAGPAGTEIVACFSFLQSQIALLQAAQNASPTPTVGAATAFTVADLALDSAVQTVGGVTQGALETACGPLVLHVENRGMTVAAQISALAALFAK